MAENTIDNLSIQVTASADNAARVFDRLASSAGRVKGAASGAAGGMQDMVQGARDAGTETQKAGEQSGSAAPKIRGVGKDAKTAGDNAKKGASGIGSFWQSLKRIAFYRAIRSVIKGITEAFQTGITNLYHWSDAINGHFATAMDRLATSSLYLKNSLGAMASPLIESLMPVLDTVIDKVVEVLNFFNMLVSAVSGADTYTIAKKTATVWDGSAEKVKKLAKSAADDIKRTILGFDEINKLVKPNASSGGSGSSSGTKTPDYSSMFEEKPLTGLFKKISDITSGWPDWLKALLGIGTAGLAIFGIPALLKAIWGWLKKLFTMHIPDFFKWLFGPKGKNGIDFELPKEIELPDADINTNLKEGDWSALDDLSGKPVYLSPKLDNKPQVLLENFKDDWNKAPSRTVYLSPKLDNKADVLWEQFKKNWMAVRDTLFASPKLDNTATVLWGKFKGEWMAARTILYATPKLDNYGSVIFNKFKSEWNGVNPVVTAFVQLAKSGWSTISGFVGTQVTVAVHLSKGNFYSLQSWVGTWTPVEIWLQRGNFWSLEDWLGDEIWVKVNLYMGSGGYLVDGQSRSFGGGGTSGGGGGRGRKALGGILSNGIWQNIPQYAGGTSKAHGSLFLAGEAGPEVVGHVGGRTEVLNKSQIASAMYSAVQAAMAPASANFAAAAYAMNADNMAFDMEMFAEMVRQGVESAMERERDILRQQLDTLRQINAKDTTVEIPVGQINRANSRLNRRSGVTVAPVTT